MNAAKAQKATNAATIQPTSLVLFIFGVVELPILFLSERAEQPLEEIEPTEQRLA